MLRRLAEAVGSGLACRLSAAARLRKHVEEFKECVQRAASIEQRVDLARAHRHLKSNQKRGEIIGLLQEVASLRPRRLCEIGADRGGTLALFASVAAADACIVSIDIRYPHARVAAHEFLGQARQRVMCLPSDSHRPETLEQVRDRLQGAPLDFLFIDGDHSYGGVRRDYQMYGPLVRRGGIIAFHDIVPDSLTRWGRQTASCVGDVPRFWSELKAAGSDWAEFIDDPDQDGYGIGMLRVPQDQSSTERYVSGPETGAATQ